MAIYSNYSPYADTDLSKGYLDVMNFRTVPAEANDVLFTVTASYTHRPDLLAYDLYQNSSLWWVFAQRNPSVLKDPIYDLEPGVQIYLPKLSSMKQTLGI
jgi:hypothetical protein